MKRILVIAGLALLCLAGLLMLRAPQIRSAANVYLFGYPLVIMDVTREASNLAIGPENTLQRVRRFPDATTKAVVRPNVDTLYTTAFIDTDKGPWLFEMGENSERYALMPFMDAWTNVFAAPGTRASGSVGARYLLVGRNWQGEPPAGTMLLRAPTRMVWLIGRTQTNGSADYPVVHRLQDGITLKPLDPAPTQKPWEARRAVPPIVQMKAMPTSAFFSRLNALLPDNPPAAADGAMMGELSALGPPASWSWLDAICIDIGRRLADWQVKRQLSAGGKLVRGWSTPPPTLGAYGTNYGLRAAVAMTGLGANLPQDAMYPMARVDSQGRPLDGSHRYRLHFAPQALPPVRAFWSVTAYGTDDFLIDNPLHRFALGDRDPLHFNADGSLDLLVAAQAPAREEERSNWLPVKAGQPFQLNARLYWPQPAALNGQWGMPAVERID